MNNNWEPKGRKVEKRASPDTARKREDRGRKEKTAGPNTTPRSSKRRTEGNCTTHAANDRGTGA